MKDSQYAILMGVVWFAPVAGDRFRYVMAAVNCIAGILLMVHGK